jgi:predicted DNA-binding transcriptional regulator AlpA
LWCFWWLQITTVSPFYHPIFLHHYSIFDSGFLLLARRKSNAEISKNMQEISFNEVPQALAHLINKVEKIETLLNVKQPQAQESDQWLNLSDLCKYHPDHPAKPTVYAWIGQRLIPYHKKGKKLMFLKSEIDAWLKEGRRKTAAEIQSEAELYVNGRKGDLK